MGRRALNQRPYKVLPPELRPRYKKSADFRLMRRAIRAGWAQGVGAERVAEWGRDLLEALAGPRTRRFRVAAINVLLELEKQKARRISSYYQLRRQLLSLQIEVLSMCKDDQGRVQADIYESLWARVLCWFMSGADPEEFPTSAFERWTSTRGLQQQHEEGEV
jgi:hypothetical protein